MNTFTQWRKSGQPWIWLNAGCVAISLILVVGLLLMIAVRGLGHFWPGAILQAQVVDASGRVTVMGEIADSEEVSAQQLAASGAVIKKDQAFHTRYLIKTGNRDITGKDFSWVLAEQLQQATYPQDLVTVERREWGNFYGRLIAVKQTGQEAAAEKAWPVLQTSIARAVALYEKIYDIEKYQIGDINARLEKLKIVEKKLTKHQETALTQAEVDDQRVALTAQYDALQKELEVLHTEASRDIAIFNTVDNQRIEIPVEKIVRAYQPNTMNTFQKIQFYGVKLWEFVSADPREANTEGGIFPSIFGTVLMVLLMSVIVTPAGVIAAVYLREYAKQGLVTRLIRIAVNNLAGVPSIVYGVFGLGFFVYFLGAHIDQFFFADTLPSPTFGTPGLLWASITLSLLTLPVVIVATEEGLSRIPRSIREGSLALGATQAETIWRVVLPMASPAIMTGLILAVARAAGEVAPLMLVGVVKLAPALPLDGSYPFLHLDRKFMHLGFHIFDVGFQSPNVEAARPLVYATSFLLVLVVVVLNIAAIAIRNHLREKYKSLEM